MKTKEKIKQNKAITLIALIITIIILLILSTIIILELKNTSLFSKTKEAKNKYDISVNEENDILDSYSNVINHKLKNQDGKAPDAKIEKYEKSDDYLFCAKIKVSFIGNGDKIDYKNCGYAFSESKDKIGTNKENYKCNLFNGENKEIEVAAKTGNVYLHILATNIKGISKEIVSENSIEIDKTKDFTYTGSEQVAKLLAGNYQIECWGANGSGINSSYPGGNGAYTSGKIKLDNAMNAYVYVGQYAGDAKYNVNVFNGGGNGTSWSSTDVNKTQTIYCGGGATDIRLVDGNWDNSESLCSRIMVAAGGGRRWLCIRTS